MEEKYLVIYDIADPVRLQRVAKILLDYGIRVQRSVFEISGYKSNVKQIRSRLKNVIDSEKDGVKIFRICESCCSKKKGIGIEASNTQDNASWRIL